jgi:hypothetical protein
MRIALTIMHCVLRSFLSPLIILHCTGRLPMPFMVRGFYNNNPLTLTSGTAREAFTKAIEWHVVEKFSNISISDGIKNYTIAEFSLVMALKDIANTIDRDEPPLGRPCR